MMPPLGAVGLAALLLAVLLGTVRCKGEEASFSSDLPVDRFLFSPATDSFFIGGLNFIYEVERRGLGLKKKVRTGPKLDSPSCHASGCGGDEDAEARRTWRNNTNKVLLIDNENGKLITCGSLFQVNRQ